MKPLMSSEKDIIVYVAKRYGYAAGLALLRAKAHEQAKAEIDQLNGVHKTRRELTFKLINNPTTDTAEQLKTALAREAGLRSEIRDKTAEIRTAMRPLRTAVKLYDTIIPDALRASGYDVNAKTELDIVDEKLIETRRKTKTEAKA